MNVGQVAAAVGISVRTLHHWDAVGLLTPSGRTTAGYRSYDEADLRRLQQVLTYRELGFALDEVRELLDDPAVDVLDHLRRQQELLADRIARLQTVAAMVHRAVEANRMGINLDPQELREVFGAHDPTLHAEEAEQRWSGTDAYAQSKARTSLYSTSDWLRVQAEAHDVERRFADVMLAGRAADDPSVTALAEEHRQQISRNYHDCDESMHRALADLYVSDERFAAHYDVVAPGLARYIHDAVHADTGGEGAFVP